MMMLGLLYLPYVDFRPKFHVIRDRSSSNSVTESPYPSVLYLEEKNTYRLRTFLVMHVIHMTIFSLFVCSCKKLTYKMMLNFPYVEFLSNFDVHDTVRGP